MQKKATSFFLVLFIEAKSPIFWYEHLAKERKDEITNVIEDSLQNLMVTAGFEKLGLGVADAQQFLKWHFGNQLGDKVKLFSCSALFKREGEGQTPSMGLSKLLLRVKRKA